MPISMQFTNNYYPKRHAPITMKQKDVLPMTTRGVSGTPTPTPTYRGYNMIAAIQGIKNTCCGGAR